MERIGIIDIGSNSIRLVIYEQSEQAHRVIDESKLSARLSEHIDADGMLAAEAVATLIDTLNHFSLICEASGVKRIRAVATAAIRNAANSAAVIERLRRHTGLSIEVLSGSEEARIGFLGVRNTIDIKVGFLVDIGGGSTEVTLFKDREIVHSVSFPFGAVNTTKRFTHHGEVDLDSLYKIRSMVEQAIDQEPWIRQYPGLPLVGLGGTIRNLCKIDQKRKKYSLALTHNYMLSDGDISDMMASLATVPVEKRKKVPGLSKDRADIIVPGTVILQTLFKECGASHYVISGSGLRDGLFYETLYPEQPAIDDVLEHSVRNLLELHPSSPKRHVELVNRLALTLYDDLQPFHQLPERARTYMHVASLLYRIGTTVDYYHYDRHTFYLIANSRINGMSHKEILLCAMIASHKTKSRARLTFLEHRDILDESDLSLVVLLGTLLRLAIALDRSETQTVTELSAALHGLELRLSVAHRHGLSIERQEVAALEKEFKKVWGLQIRLSTT